MASELKKLSDGKVFLIETVKKSNIDALNCIQSKLTIVEMKNKPRGNCVLVQAFDFNDEVEKARKIYLKMNKNKKTTDRTIFYDSKESTATNCSFIVWKDKKIVTFYTNYLAYTPLTSTVDGNSEETKICVHVSSNL